jgi:hypothetical protein
MTGRIWIKFLTDCSKADHPEMPSNECHSWLTPFSRCSAFEVKHQLLGGHHQACDRQREVPRTVLAGALKKRQTTIAEASS